MVKKKNESRSRLQAKDIDTVEALRVTAGIAYGTFVDLRGVRDHYTAKGFPYRVIVAKWGNMMRAGLIKHGCDCGCNSNCSELTEKALKLAGIDQAEWEARTLPH